MQAISKTENHQIFNAYKITTTNAASNLQATSVIRNDQASINQFQVSKTDADPQYLISKDLMMHKGLLS